MDLGAPVRPSSADTRPARGHWCVSEPEACWSFPFEPLPAPRDDAGEGEGSSDECVSATPLMSFSVITTQWIGPCHEPCVVKQWPAVFAARLSGIGRIITASSSFSMQDKSAGELFRFVPPREDLMQQLKRKNLYPYHLKSIVWRI